MLVFSFGLFGNFATRFPKKELQFLDVFCFYRFLGFFIHAFAHAIPDG